MYQSRQHRRGPEPATAIPTAVSTGGVGAVLPAPDAPATPGRMPGDLDGTAAPLALRNRAAQDCFPGRWSGRYRVAAGLSNITQTSCRLGMKDDVYTFRLLDAP